RRMQTGAIRVGNTSALPVEISPPACDRRRMRTERKALGKFDAQVGGIVLFVETQPTVGRASGADSCGVEADRPVDVCGEARVKRYLGAESGRAELEGAFAAGDERETLGERDRSGGNAPGLEINHRFVEIDGV